MFSKFNISEIVLDGFKLLRGKTKIIPFLFFYFFTPVFISIFLIKIEIIIDQSIISSIISSISLFSGLLFSVIFILTGNYSTRKTLLNSFKLEEEDKRYLARYKVFTQNTSTLILLSVVIAILIIIILLSFSLIEKTEIAINISYLLYIIQTLVFVLLFNYLLTILIIIKEVYAMIYDDINLKK